MLVVLILFFYMHTPFFFFFNDTATTEIYTLSLHDALPILPMVGNKPSFNAHIFDRDENVAIAFGMGITAEKVAQRWRVTRELQDEFALASHQRAIAAQKAGEFSDEITPFEIVEKV